MIVVKARKGESTESVIRRFQKKVVQEGLMDELRDRSVYKKPSAIKQERLKVRKRKIKKYQRKKYDK